MNSWASCLLVTAALSAGCTAKLDGGGGLGPGSGIGSGNGLGPGNGTGGSVGAGGSAAADDPTLCVPGVPQTSQLPRLTRAQYDNTIRDLLGLEGNPSSMLAPDAPGSVDQRAWAGYQTAAQSLAAQVMADASARAKVIPCAPGDDGGAACARQLVESFGARAFRRPLTAEEVTRFETLFTNRAQITTTGSFEEAAELIVRAFLLSPSFLTRAEIAETRAGDYIALTGHEVASRLSYMLWGSMPDDALLAVAAAGELSSPEQIRAQAERMLLDQRARGTVRAFHRSWTGMDAGSLWSEVQRDASLFPLFQPAQVQAMNAETERIFEHVVFERGGGLKALLTEPVAFVNADLAPLYGLNAADYGPDLQQVELDPTQRAGVFTRVGFLTSHGMFDRTSPILRGAFIQKEVLCTPIGAPPPGAESTPLPTAGLGTNRERVDAQTADSACAGCHHTIINPTGFALEAYDAIGSYRQTETGSGAPLVTAASVLVGAKTVNVTGPVDLFQAIADSPEAQTCYARHWVQFAYERSLTNQDSCTVDTLATKLAQGDYTVLNLISDLTQSDSFRYRAVPEVAP